MCGKKFNFENIISGCFIAGADIKMLDRVKTAEEGASLSKACQVVSGSSSYLLLFPCNKIFAVLKEASSICRRNDSVDKQLSHSLLLHSNTGPLLTMHDPCIPQTLFHADDHIISSISLNQGDMSIRKQTHHRHPILFLMLSSLCHSLSFSFCHSFTYITFLIRFLHPSLTRLFF